MCTTTSTRTSRRRSARPSGLPRRLRRSRPRSPEDAAELLEPAIIGAHVNVEQIGRTLLPLSKDQDGFDKMAEAYETKTEVPLQKALETHVPAEEMGELHERVPWRGFPPPNAEGGAGGGAAA